SPTGIAHGTVTAIDNWWGCNGGPGVSGCDTTAGSSTVNPWLVLSGAPVTVTAPATATVTADVRHDSNGAAVVATEPGLNGVSDSFTDPEPAGATCTGAPTSFSGGTAAASCTYAPNGVSGAGHVVVTVDNQSVTIPVTVDQPAAVSTNPGNQTVLVGGTASFTATATGYPTPTVQWQLSTDGGTTFANIAGATSSPLSFTATAAQNGNEYRAVFTNPGGSATTTAATLTVQQAPTFTSAGSTTFTAGTAGTFTVTTSGIPNPAISESGALPSGVTLTDNGDGTATLAGTPATGTGGTYSITLNAANGVSPAGSQSFTLTVDEAPHFSSPTTVTFQSGVASSFLVTTDRGFPTPALLVSPTLPAGLAFTDNGDGTATISGSTTSLGQNPVAITAQNTAGSVQQTLIIVVTQPPAITSAASTTFTTGTAGTFTVTTAGYPNAALSESGALPNGVTFTDNGDGTATLAGTPAAGTGGTYPFTITASNGIGSDATQ
ncbi:MAG: hypothetical protein J0H43_07640, partial [Actinobacteria bacterium]|nr:hypothetical protein [Actinomycetota bacterium]